MVGIVGRRTGDGGVVEDIVMKHPDRLIDGQMGAHVICDATGQHFNRVRRYDEDGLETVMDSGPTAMDGRQSVGLPPFGKGLEGSKGGLFRVECLGKGEPGVSGKSTGPHRLVVQYQFLQIVSKTVIIVMII